MRGPAARPIVIAAGGTGGHFYPAEALAGTLTARGHRVVLMTDRRTASRLGPVFAGGEHHVLSAAGIAGRGGARAVRATFLLGAGILQARSLLAGLDAAAIVGFGGYPSVPPVMASTLLRRRPAIVLHEQNAALGRANRFLARRANLLALGMADTSHVPNATATTFTGNPVRREIRALSGLPYQPPTDRLRLLVTGGSLGARIFSEVVPAAIANLPASLRCRLQVVQQCRVEDLAQARAVYRAAGVEAELAPFFEDMAGRLAAAHLVISRAGASICAEIAVVGRPALLVPLPTAIDDHQTANARALDGAQIVAQADLTPAALAALLEGDLLDPAALAACARRIAACGRPHAADDLADAVQTLIAPAEALQ